MKMMILVPSFSRGSPVLGAFLFAKYLREKNLDVVFVSLDSDYGTGINIIKEITESDINYECLNIVGWWGISLNRSRLQEYCRNKGVNVVLAYMLRPTLITSSLSNVVRMAFVRGMLREDYSFSYGKPISKILIFLEMKALKKMDHVFSMTGAMTRWLGSEGIDLYKTSAVNNFVDVRSINSSIVPNVPCNRKEIDIGMFCNFIPRKRIDVAIRAISIVTHDYQRHDVKLHLAGYGPLLSDMKKLSYDLALRNNVIFHGLLAEPLGLMQEMDLILLTSESEGVPRCLMEALSLGKTVIASDIPGVNELIRDGQTGYLLPVGDVEQLASLINRVIQNELFIPSRPLVNYMLENYDLNIACEMMLKQIEKVFNEKEFVH